MPKYIPQFTRPQAILFVALSPILTLFAAILVILDEAWDLVTEEIPAFYREDVIPAFKWAVIEPLVALSIRARLAREAYAERVSRAFRYFRLDLRWAIKEASAFLKEEAIKPSRKWLVISIKDTGRRALRLVKTLAGR